jgi:glycerol uptake facilitator-like aquaporin
VRHGAKARSVIYLPSVETDASPEGQVNLAAQMRTRLVAARWAWSNSSRDWPEPVTPLALRGSPTASEARRDLRLSALCEGALTLVLLFCVQAIVRWVFGPSPISSSVHGLHARLVIVGAIVATLLPLLILSPLGRTSGGHMNPVSLAMWRYGILRRQAVPYYIAAQLAGSVLGVLLGRAVWGVPLGRQPVSYGVLHPATNLGALAFFALEAGTMAAIIVPVGLCLASRRSARAVPLVVGLLVGTAIASLGTLTGGSDNPARQFGPAIMSGSTRELWIFILAPLTGALIAPLIHRALRCNPLTTHALCGPGAQSTRCRAVQPPGVKVSDRPSGNSVQVTAARRRSG